MSDEAAVREAMWNPRCDTSGNTSDSYREGVAALARLAEQARAAERLQRERDEFKASFMRENEAALDFQIKMLAAEQRAEQYAEALRWYDDHKRDDGSYDGEMWGDLTALARREARA